MAVLYCDGRPEPKELLGSATKGHSGLSSSTEDNVKER